MTGCETVYHGVRCGHDLYEHEQEPRHACMVGWGVLDSRRVCFCSGYTKPKGWGTPSFDNGRTDE